MQNLVCNSFSTFSTFSLPVVVAVVVSHLKCLSKRAPLWYLKLCLPSASNSPNKSSHKKGPLNLFLVNAMSSQYLPAAVREPCRCVSARRLLAVGPPKCYAGRMLHEPIIVRVYSQAPLPQPPLRKQMLIIFRVPPSTELNLFIKSKVIILQFAWLEQTADLGHALALLILLQLERLLLVFLK